MPNPEDIKKLGDLQLSQTTNIGLASGDDQDGPWESLTNVRLEVDGNYAFWKTRGGTTVVESFFGQILTTYPFRTVVGAQVYEYIAVHTGAGHVYLWDINAETSNQIATGYDTDNQIQFAVLGQLLYIFDYDGGKSSYYNVSEDVEKSFLNYDRAYITGSNWLYEPAENQENLFDFKVGGKIIVFPNDVPATGVQVYSSSSTDAKSIKPRNYKANSFLYEYNGGKFLKTLDGTEYKSTQFITFSEYDSSFDFTVEGSGDDFVIKEYYIPLNEAGEPSFESYVTTIDEVSGDSLTFDDPVGVTQSGSVGGLPSFVNRNVILPYSPDLEDLVGRTANKKLSEDGTAVVANQNYEKPRIYRQYAIFEMLDDGSVTMLGRPTQIKATPKTIQIDGSKRLSFTLSSVDTNISKRFLCATRWQSSPEDAFTPTNENYPNSPLFIVKEIDSQQLFISDKTPDDSMFRAINELMPISSGVPDLFGPEGLDVNTIAQFEGSLLIGGYTINRPVPKPYTNLTTAKDENIYIDIEQTSQLANDMALAFQFEYTDGRRSSIVETEEYLQEGEIVEFEQRACEQFKAKATHEVTGAATADGDIDITYDGVTVTVPLNTTDHNTTEAVAQAISGAINNDSNIRLGANVSQGSEVVYTELRFGESFNGNTVSVSLSGGAGNPGITFDTQSPSLSGAKNPEGETAKGYITPIANYVSDSPPLYITFDGTDSSGSASVNPSDSLLDICNKIKSLLDNVSGISTNWDVYLDKRPTDNLDRVVIESKNPGDLSFNDIVFELDTVMSGPTSEFIVELSNPEGTVSKVNYNNGGQTHPTAGAVEPCSQATGNINVTGNGLPTDNSEDHTLHIAGISTSPVTINDTDSNEQIVDKYIAEVRSTRSLDIIVRAEKVDLGSGEWAAKFYYRQYGEIGNGKEVSVSGDSDISLSEVNFFGGDDGPNVAQPITETISANRLQIHSLNQLVSKVYILGRTEDGSKEFHLINEYEITEAGAAGQVIELPNAKSDLDEIEGDIFNTVSSNKILEAVELENYLLVGTPPQQYSISAQKQIKDNSRIERIVPIQFDVDKSQMRYRVAIFTENNIQQAYYVEQGTEFGSVFRADVEISNYGIVAINREGITSINNTTFFQSRNGLHRWQKGQEQKILDTRRYDVLNNNNVIDVVHNENQNEYWFICQNNTVVVFDPEEGSFKRMQYEGDGIGTLRAGTFYAGNFYIGLNSDLAITDDQTVYDDIGQSVTGKVKSNHLGNNLTQVKLIEIAVEGQGYNCNLDIDLQPERRESVTSSWNKSFDADYQGGEKELKMHGTPWQINRRAIMPRLQLSFSGDGEGFFGGIRLKQVTTENKGKSRQ
jgi:hypothetical protein